MTSTVSQATASSGGVWASDDAFSDKMSDNTSSTGYTRAPLQPRPINIVNGTPSVASSFSASSIGSKPSSSGGHQKFPSSSSLCSKASSAGGMQRIPSMLESSNNENNMKFYNSTSRSKINDSDSSTLAHTGQPVSADIMRSRSNSNSRPRARSRSRSNVRPSGGGSSPGRPSSHVGENHAQHRSSASSSQQSLPTKIKAGGGASTGAATDDPESVTIEEMRRNPNGEGYTTHRYIRGRMLGKGGFAKVYWCTALDTNKSYAVKIVPKANLVKTRARQKLQAEIRIHRTLKHKHICEYKHFFEDRNNCYILLELCHHQSMNELIKRRKRLTEPEVQYYMRQLIQAVRYMHENNVIHRDLKLGNLFLDKHLRIKVGDLGLATKLESPEEKRKTICGTPNYIAPEVINGNKETRGHSFEVDIWSMGVICFTTLVGKPPYEAKDVKATYQRILNNEYEFPSHLPISGHARELIISMLQTAPSKRPTLDEISAHPFFTFAEEKIPHSLPSCATHVVPIWQENANGELVALQQLEEEEEHRGRTASYRSKKDHGLHRPGSSGRLPLAAKDPNLPSSNAQESANKLEKYRSSVREKVSKLEKLRAERGGAADVRTTSRGRGRDTEPDPQRGLQTGEGKTRSQRFHIYDDNEEGVNSQEARKISHQKPPQSRPSLPTSDIDPMAELTEKAAACSLGSGDEPPLSPPPRISPELQKKDDAAASKSPSLPRPKLKEPALDRDLQVLESMHKRLKESLARGEPRKDAGEEAHIQPVSCGGASKWVTRYVDYTSKYGLGFLLNDGSAGVYFNDSTKAVLAPKGKTFQYVERRKASHQGSDGDGTEQQTSNEPWSETYSSDLYPDSLQKKVTLLKHFRNYLLEQQKRSDEEEQGEFSLWNTSVDLGDDDDIDASELVYLKKWVRTKHAILFRLSNMTVQVVFYDHTEILLSSEAQLVTYVDKARKRETYNLDDVVSGNSAEMAKRLKYAKDILHQLITGAKR